MNATALVLLLAAFALASPSPDGHYKLLESRLDIQGDHVTLDGKSYELGKDEKVESAYAVDDLGWGNEHNALCKATTIRAARADDGSIVLLRLFRVKRSKSGGLACRFTSDLSKLSPPYAFDQYVIRPTADGMAVKHVFVADGLERPDLSVEQLLKPDVAESEPLKGYLDGGARVGSVNEMKYARERAPDGEAAPPAAAEAQGSSAQ